MKRHNTLHIINLILKKSQTLKTLIKRDSKPIKSELIGWTHFVQIVQTIFHSYIFLL